MATGQPRTGHARAERLFSLADQSLQTAFKKSEEAYQHMGDRGGARESAVRDFLRDQLPSRFAVAAGEVIDAAGNCSGQTDVIIYDDSNTRPLSIADQVVTLPAEALLAVVEVKSTLTKVETNRAIGSAIKLRELRPWDAPWTSARRGGQHADDGLPRIFSTVLAFRSDLSEDDWAMKEMLRVRDSCDELTLPTAHVDRVVVLGRGMLIPSDGTVFVPPPDASVIGQWFLSLAGFLAREVDRRETFPWQRYRLPHSDSWQHIADARNDAPPVARATAKQRAQHKLERNTRALGEV